MIPAVMDPRLAAVCVCGDRPGRWLSDRSETPRAERLSLLLAGRPELVDVAGFTGAALYEEALWSA